MALRDEAALHTFYQRHRVRVYNTAISYLQVTTDAEEATQDVFAKLWKRADTFKGNSQVTTWMYRITVNTCLSALKSRKRRSLFGVLTNDLAPPDFHHPGVKLEERESSQALYAAIYRLPDRQKTAFVLSFLEGLPRKQVAAIMQLSLKAIEGLLLRAKKQLRTELANEFPNRGKTKIK